MKLPLCIGPKGVNSIVKQIQNRIIDRGYVTTRVVAPEQDLTGGELTLIVKLNQKRI
ncbi:POTRA domain-containing protein [Bisgaard Taxon 10/6]|uniref:POTRA domain-containing protein n=1 Tax=Exercitatus varius TaxID=67857 RepID=A0ABT6ERT3_9PAST|nr:POTRA domain-containing protein [Exercitatus varius]MDG2940339.1 POTRA domain-containing protein [Exercitatus varius]MDG2946241.1 POTRA domain-containing protein [Exercitatus varius]